MSVDTKNPLVSVIIPVYNTEDYLEECLESVINQTLKEIEIICIDDKSTDNSAKILEKYRKKDHRLKILYNEENMGLSRTRNKGLLEIKGKYVSFIDSDDKIELDLYEKLLNFSKEYNQDVIIFNTVRFNDEGVVWKSILHTESIKGETVPKTNIIEHRELVYDTLACNKFIKTDFLKEKNITFTDRLYEDLLFSMELFTSTDSVGIYPNVKYYWRVRENNKKSITQEINTTKNLIDRIFIIQETIKIFKSNIKYEKLLDVLYGKLVKIDILQFINEFDRSNKEYQKIMFETVKPLVEELPKSAYNNIDDVDKLKYKLFLDEDVDSLIGLVNKERESKTEINRLKRIIRQKQREINKLNNINKKKSKKIAKKDKEIKKIKSTKGWLKYKSNNIYQRIKKDN